MILALILLIIASLGLLVVGIIADNQKWFGFGSIIPGCMTLVGCCLVIIFSVILLGSGVLSEKILING